MPNVWNEADHDAVLPTVDADCLTIVADRQPASTAGALTTTIHDALHVPLDTYFLLALLAD